MPQKELAGHTVDVDDEGFITDPAAWNREIAVAIAAEENIELGDRHWVVIDFKRADFAEKGVPPTVRRVTKVGGVPTKELYGLFPKGPAKKAARIAGLGKPKGCI